MEEAKKKGKKMLRKEMAIDNGSDRQNMAKSTMTKDFLILYRIVTSLIEKIVKLQCVVSFYLVH